METDAIEATEANPEVRLPVALHLLVIGLTAVLLLAFGGAVYVLSAHGAEWTRGMDQEIGEFVFQRAKVLAEQGERGAALDTLARAMELPFEDPRQKAWAQREYARLLLEEGKPETAAVHAEASARAYPSDMTAHGILCQALRQADAHETLLAAARAWHAAARQAGETGSLAHARYHEGVALEGLGRAEEALQAYLHGTEEAPDSMNNYHAAKLLADQGKHNEAAALLDAYLPVASGWRLEAAQALLEKIRAGGLGS